VNEEERMREREKKEREAMMEDAKHSGAKLEGMEGVMESSFSASSAGGGSTSAASSSVAQCQLAYSSTFTALTDCTLVCFPVSAFASLLSPAEEFVFLQQYLDGLRNMAVKVRRHVEKRVLPDAAHLLPTAVPVPVPGHNANASTPTAAASGGGIGHGSVRSSRSSSEFGSMAILASPKSSFTGSGTNRVAISPRSQTFTRGVLDGLRIYEENLYHAQHLASGQGWKGSPVADGPAGKAGSSSSTSSAMSGGGIESTLTASLDRVSPRRPGPRPPLLVSERFEQLLAELRESGLADHPYTKALESVAMEEARMREQSSFSEMGMIADNRWSSVLAKLNMGATNTASARHVKALSPNNSRSNSPDKQQPNPPTSSSSSSSSSISTSSNSPLISIFERRRAFMARKARRTLDALCRVSALAAASPNAPGQMSKEKAMEHAAKIEQMLREAGVAPEGLHIGEEMEEPADADTSITVDTAADASVTGTSDDHAARGLLHSQSQPVLPASYWDGHSEITTSASAAELPLAHPTATAAQPSNVAPSKRSHSPPRISSPPSRTSLASSPLTSPLASPTASSASHAHVHGHGHAAPASSSSLTQRAGMVTAMLHEPRHDVHKFLRYASKQYSADELAAINATINAKGNESGKVDVDAQILEEKEATALASPSASATRPTSSLSKPSTSTGQQRKSGSSTIASTSASLPAASASVSTSDATNKSTTSPSLSGLTSAVRSLHTNSVSSILAQNQSPERRYTRAWLSLDADARNTFVGLPNQSRRQRVGTAKIARALGLPDPYEPSIAGHWTKHHIDHLRRVVQKEQDIVIHQLQSTRKQASTQQQAIAGPGPVYSPTHARTASGVSSVSSVLSPLSPGSQHYGASSYGESSSSSMLHDGDDISSPFLPPAIGLGSTASYSPIRQTTAAASRTAAQTLSPAVHASYDRTHKRLDLNATSKRPVTPSSSASILSSASSSSPISSSPHRSSPSLHHSHSHSHLGLGSSHPSNTSIPGSRSMGVSTSSTSTSSSSRRLATSASLAALNSLQHSLQPHSSLFSDSNADGSDLSAAQMTRIRRQEREALMKAVDGSTNEKSQADGAGGSHSSSSSSGSATPNIHLTTCFRVPMLASNASTSAPPTILASISAPPTRRNQQRHQQQPYEPDHQHLSRGSSDAMMNVPLGKPLSGKSDAEFSSFQNQLSPPLPRIM